MDRDAFVRTAVRQHVWWLVVLVVFSSGCSAQQNDASPWVEEEVTFVAHGMPIHGTYRHRTDTKHAPAALLIAESGPTDRNGDNAVAGHIGTLAALASLLSDRGIESLRYDKVGTGRTGLGPYAGKPGEVGSSLYTAEAKAAVRFLADQPRSDQARILVYGHGEGAVHALMLAIDTSVGAPKIHALGLFQPLAGRYLDLITARVRADMDAQVKAGQATPQQADDVIAAWTAAVAQARKDGTVPAQLPNGLSAILNPGNVSAVLQTDGINPIALAMLVPAGTPVLMTCSDADKQATCEAVKPLADALGHTKLDFVQLGGVSHVLKDDPTDSITNYANKQPLSSQLAGALNEFVGSIP
jgi:uncharacterized protein